MSQITYTQTGDFLIPNIQLTGTKTQPLGRYGRMRRAYLKEHNRALLNDLMLSEQLYSHLAEIDRTAHQRVEQLMNRLLEQSPPPDKETNQMAWVQHMNLLKAQAEEIVVMELVNS